MPEPTAALARLTMISPQQAADMLNVDRETVLRWVRDGKLFASRISPRIIRLRLTDVERLRDAPPAVEVQTEAVPVLIGGAQPDTRIYVVRAAELAVCKIGIARDTAKRLATLQCASPVALELVLSFPGNSQDEAALHRHFAKYRVRGEWFRESPEVLAWVESLRVAEAA